MPHIHVADVLDLLRRRLGQYSARRDPTRIADEETLPIRRISSGDPFAARRFSEVIEAETAEEADQLFNEKHESTPGLRIEGPVIPLGPSQAQK